MAGQRLGEFEMIARYFAPLAADAPGAFGLRDDAATIALPPGEEMVVTTDAMLEGVHFLLAADWIPACHRPAGITGH